jgi:hypothetical protein
VIHFHATNKFAWTISRFVDAWAPSLKSLIASVPYDAMPFDEPVPPGVHIFTDFERLLSPEHTLVRRLHRHIAGHPDAYRTLNDPAAWASRFDLLHLLAEDGTNDFRAYRLRDIGPHVRFPAFLRWENDHRGTLGARLQAVEDARERVDRLVHGSRKLMKHKLMVVEKVNVRDADGLHRKYSAMKIGEQLVPRHVLFSTKWITKKPDVITPELAEEERLFLEEFPHAELVEDAFRVAGMDYGRIDYGFSNGRMQVWEINSNPDIVPVPERIDPMRMEGQARSAELVAQAFQALLAEPLDGPPARTFGPGARMWWRGHARLSRWCDRYRR